MQTYKFALRSIQGALIVAASMFFLSGCETTENQTKPTSKQENKQKKVESESRLSLLNKPELPPISLHDRLHHPQDDYLKPPSEDEEVYSFVAQNLPVRDALQIFSRAYGLNIVSSSDVSGSISVEFNGLPLEQAMSAMLGSLGLHWEKKDNLIKVQRWYTRTFTLDYLRLVRSGQGSSNANVSSSVSGGAEGGAGGGDSDDGTFELKQEDSVEFWDELTEQLESMISEDGRIALNRMSGTIQVTDDYSRVSDISRYIQSISKAIHRQVEIDVRIVELELNDDFSLGVDWSLISSRDSGKTNGDLNLTNIITQPLGGFGAIMPNFSLNLFETERRINFDVVLSALSEQGEVNVVSKPRIRTMNNQPAMIKVGTDRTFFIRSVTTDTSAAGSTSMVEDTPSVVTEGLVMALTPQISANGWIMMDISPIITRVTSVERVLDDRGNTTSSSPNLDIRQTSSLVRMENGNTIVIGGLIQNSTSNTEREVPGLGKIPLFGKLFSGKYDVNRKKELLIFLTANVVDSPMPEFAYNQ